MLDKLSRGDTIIEVLLAVVVFSMVAIGAMTVMNQGTNSAQRALEITLVKQQIDAQAEALRASQQVHLASPRANDDWIKITSAENTPSATAADSSQCPDISTGGYFAMNGSNARLYAGVLKRADVLSDSVPPYSKVVYNTNDTTSIQGVYGLWIERTKHDGNPGFVDFKIRACWAGPGLDVPMTLQTVVRLYEA